MKFRQFPFLLFLTSIITLSCAGRPPPVGTVLPVSPPAIPPETAPVETRVPETTPPETTHLDTVPETRPTETTHLDTVPETKPPETTHLDTVPETKPPETKPEIAQTETRPQVTAPPETKPKVATPPGTRPPVTAPPVTRPPETLPPAATPPEQSPSERFEHALRNIKTNTSLVNKYLETKAGRITEAGVSDINELVIKGTCLIDGNEFHISYEIASAVQNGNTFRIPFLAEDRKNGISRRDELFWTPAEDEAGLLLSFDDNFFQNWYRYFDMFDIYGAKVTFFITGSLDANIKNFCTEALRRGHDLGYHTRSHTDLTRVSRREFDNETAGGAAAFSAAGIPLGSFAYPYGFSTPWMREALAPVFPVTRGYGANIRIYDQQTIKNRFIISKAVDNVVYPDDKKFENAVRMMLLVTKFSRGVIPLTSHVIADDAEWGIKPKRLEYLLKTARDFNLKFYTYSEKTKEDR